MDKLTSYDICTKYGCLSRIFTLITYFIMLFVVILLLNISRHRTQNYGFCNRGWIPLESADV